MPRPAPSTSPMRACLHGRPAGRSRRCCGCSRRVPWAPRARRRLWDGPARASCWRRTVTRSRASMWRAGAIERARSAARGAGRRGLRLRGGRCVRPARHGGAARRAVRHGARRRPVPCAPADPTGPPTPRRWPRSRGRAGTASSSRGATATRSARARPDPSPRPAGCIPGDDRLAGRCDRGVRAGDTPGAGPGPCLAGPAPPASSASDPRDAHQQQLPALTLVREVRLAIAVVVRRPAPSRSTACAPGR